MLWTESHQEIPTGHSPGVNNTYPCYLFWYMPWMPFMKEDPRNALPSTKPATSVVGYENTPLQDSIANHAAIPHAQALSTNELPIVQLSELANGPHTPAQHCLLHQWQSSS